MSEWISVYDRFPESRKTEVLTYNSKYKIISVGSFGVLGEEIGWWTLAVAKKNLLPTGCHYQTHRKKIKGVNFYAYQCKRLECSFSRGVYVLLWSFMRIR